MTSWADEINDIDVPLTIINTTKNTEEKIHKPNSYIEYKKEILTFLFASSEEQPILFRKLLNKRLNEYLDSMKDWIPEFEEQNKMLAKDIFLSKEEAIKHLTVILKKQMEDYKKGIKPPPNVFTSSIIEKKSNPNLSRWNKGCIISQ